MTTHQPPPEFTDFLVRCDEEGLDPITELRTRAHARADEKFGEIEDKYREGREGKTWADFAGEVYDDVKEGYDELTKEAADWYYGND